MNERTGRAFQASGFVFFYADDALEIVRAGNRTGQFGELDLHALGRLEVQVVIHGFRNRIPCNGDSSIAGFRLHILRRRRKFLFLGNRISGAPFSLDALGIQMEPIELKLFVKKPGFHHVWCLMLLGPTGFKK